MICFRLFLSFLYVGLFSVGGGYAALPLIQSQVLSNSWMTMGEFADLITIAEMTPGPIAINSATFVGIRIAGVPGALAATFGCVFPSLLIVSLLACLYRRYKSVPVLQSALSCLRPVVVALIASAALGILNLVALGGAGAGWEAVRWPELGLSAAAFIALRKFRLNPILAIAGCGAVFLVGSLLAPAA